VHDATCWQWCTPARSGAALQDKASKVPLLIFEGRPSAAREDTFEPLRRPCWQALRPSLRSALGSPLRMRSNPLGRPASEGSRPSALRRASLHGARSGAGASRSTGTKRDWASTPARSAASKRAAKEVTATSAEHGAHSAQPHAFPPQHAADHAVGGDIRDGLPNSNPTAGAAWSTNKIRRRCGVGFETLEHLHEKANQTIHEAGASPAPR
jgi:hypothetical protein